MDWSPRVVDVPTYETAAKSLSCNRDSYIAQSILTCFFDSIPPLPSNDEAQDIIAWANRGVRK